MASAEAGGFSAQWTAMFGEAAKEDDDDDDEGFGQFLAAKVPAADSKDQQTDPSNLLNPSSAASAPGNTAASQNFLPSQLFDMDQSLYSGKSRGEQSIGHGVRDKQLMNNSFYRKASDRRRVWALIF